MNIIFTFFSIFSISLVILLWLSRLAVPCAHSQQISQTRSTNVLKANIKFNKNPDAEQGVQLLENIFNRVMNIPQVALSKNSRSQIIAQNNSAALADTKGVDYKLAIRPKESGRAYAPLSPSIQYLPQSSIGTISKNLSKNIEEIAYLTPSSTNFYRQTAPSYPPVINGKLLNRAKDNATNILTQEQNYIESWQGSNQTKYSPIQAKQEAQDKPGVWESLSNISSSDSSSNRNIIANNGEMAEKENQKHETMSLSTALAKLQGAKKSLDEIQSLPERSELGKATSIATALPNSNNQLRTINKAKASNASDNIQIADNLNINGFALRDTRQRASRNEEAFNLEKDALKQEQNFAPTNRLDKLTKSEQFDKSDRANKPTKRRQAAAVETKEIAKLALQDNDNSNYFNEPSFETGRESLALLPPNIATGIPLANLGNSQIQVTKALNQIGELKEQKINKWTVLTWRKKNTGNKASLQLFFRHGLLDAIRIFDPALIGPDFGISPGDSLDKVKERFGEPAFLLPEPLPGSGQNYIYPISQVGFQLNRNENNSKPEVSSVLIFSVK